MVAKISDLGLSKHVNDLEKIVASLQLKGMLAYLDPRYVEKSVYIHSS